MRIALVLCALLVLPGVGSAVAQTIPEEHAPYLDAADAAISETQQVIQDARRADGDPLEIGRAEDRLRFAEAHMENGRWDLAIDAAAIALPFALKALWDAEARGSQDPDEEFRNRAQTEHDLRSAQLNSTKQELTALANEAIGIEAVELSLGAADHAMTAAFQLAQWQSASQLWARGSRGEEVRNGLTAFAGGSRVYLAAAESLLGSAARASSEPLVLPDAWDATVRTVADWINDTRNPPDRIISPILGEALASDNEPMFISASAWWFGHATTFRYGLRIDREDPQAFDDTVNSTEGIISMIEASEIPLVRVHELQAVEGVWAYENATDNTTRKQRVLHAQDSAIAGLTYLNVLTYVQTGEDLGAPVPETVLVGASSTDGDDGPDDGNEGGSNAGQTYLVVGVIALALIAIFLLARTRR